MGHSLQPGTRGARRSAGPSASPAPPGLSSSVLRLQRGVGNSGVNALLQRQAVATKETFETWTKDELKAIQRQLRRLRLYRKLIDGIFGAGTEQGLVEAFGGDEWRSMTAAAVEDRLAQAVRPADGGGTSLRYGELFRDNVFDLTFGIGYLEAADPAGEAAATSEMAAINDGLAAGLSTRGYTEDTKRAIEILEGTGRSLGEKPFGRFFVKENAVTYKPVAGKSRKVHSVVRVLFNNDATGGAKSAKAFTEAMTHGDVAYYTGHGRYGTGPDFDRNFAQFRIYDKAGNLIQTIDDYEVLERELRKRGGKPWARFEEMLADGTLEVDLSSAGNLRMRERSPHMSEFGGRLITWALDQTGTKAATGAGGSLAKGAEKSTRRYRVLAFDGCRTSDYEAALRGTPGFDTKKADIIETNRTVYGGVESKAFFSFLDNVLGQKSAERILKGMNKEMREHEYKFKTDPFKFTGLKDNPLQ